MCARIKGWTVSFWIWIWVIPQALKCCTQQLPTVRGSVLGRLFQKARKGFYGETQFKEAYSEAMAALRTEALRGRGD
jgi:hypothetical protein